MSLIVYIPNANDSGQRLQQMIGQLIWQDSIEIFYNFSRLDFRLRHPTGNEDIVLLCASTFKDLDELISNCYLLNNLRLILILPDRETETVARGHLLRPRFMSYPDNDFSDVALVLKKMEAFALAYPHSLQSEIQVPRGGDQPHPPSFFDEGKKRIENKKVIKTME
jgi:hypothetical protein